MEYVDFNAKANGVDKETIQIKRNTILCCECGVKIESNSHNMCVKCLRDHIDITKSISKEVELLYCRSCERYLQPPGIWINAKWESRELLGLCLKKLKGLKSLQLIDACFVWTEKHSRRIKVKLVVEGNEIDHSSLRQGCIVEFTTKNRMCNECHRVEAKDYWRCVVQVRQHSENKKTYLYLEQLILKHKAHSDTLGIKPMHEGLDFYFASENHARKMVNFLESMVPVKVTSSRRLISHDKSSNIHHYKYTWSVEIAPLSKDSLVCLSSKVRQQLGNLAPLCLVHRVMHSMYLIDPMTGRLSELSAPNYFRAPFESICNPKQLVEFIVMDIEQKSAQTSLNKQGEMPNRLSLYDIWLVRASQLGTNECTIHTRSHLGHVLNVGDAVMGYSLQEANVNEVEFEKLKSDQIPDIILVRKCQAANKRRKWKLKHLSYGQVDERLLKDKIDFIADLEEDLDFRKNVNIYRDHTILSDAEEIVVDDADSTNSIDLAEMLDEVVNLESNNDERKTKS